ncbi:MAG TPA: preprotein translocase subunit SecG [Candidatus Deferrimicrobiaceae bacterium]
MPAFLYPIVVTLHVIVSIALILIILLQTGKGADIGAVFGGGGSNTLFGSSGPTSFLSKLTAGAAIIFMFTSLFLAYSTGNRPSSSIMKGNLPVRQMPAQGMPSPAGMPPMPAGQPSQAPVAPAAPAK